MTPSVHASAVLVGAGALLIRGPSGSGKSMLTLSLLQAADAGALHFARLVADDRVHLEAVQGRLLARPALALEGVLEIRGLGLVRMPYERAAVVSHVVDLAAADATRLPLPEQGRTVVEGVGLPRLAVAVGVAAMPLVLAFLRLGTAGFGYAQGALPEAEK